MQVAVALAYAVCFVLLRQLSFSHWVIFAGLRLSALLLVPYRYWPALAVAEAGPLAYAGMTHAGEFGWAWALSICVPPIVLAMPVVRWFRRHARLFPAGATTTVNMGNLLLCTLMVSFIWTLANLVSVGLVRLPGGYPALHYGAISAAWLIGNYLGVLTLTPLVLCIRDAWLGATAGKRWSGFVGSKLSKDFLLVLIPALVVLVCLGIDAEENIQQAARMALFLPVVWLALRHGWQGAAVGGTAASIAVVLTMPDRYDPGTMQAQVFIAFAITTMLMLGARIALLSKRGSKERDDARQTLVMAQQAVFQGEMQLRQTSQALEHVRESVHTTYGHMLDRLQFLLPKFDEREYRRVAAAAQEKMFSLADGMHPLLWHESGLHSSLREGLIARAMDECGVRYWCGIKGHEVSNLSASLQISIYRLACETVACACLEPTVSEIFLQLRSGVFQGRRWAMLRINSRNEPGKICRLQRKELLLRLSASGTGLEAIRARAAIFEGRIRVRSFDDRQRISMILHDPD